MDAITFLKQQHETAKQAFEEIEQASPDERGALWDKLAPELRLHEEIEEEHLYGPVARDAAGDAKLASWPKRHEDEVAEADELMEQIDGSPAEDPEWLALVRRLKSALDKHIQQEEGDIWPRIERVWDRKHLEQAGEAMDAEVGEAGGQG
jgi:hypothetical protein